jgi:uncharacterized membrane protein YccC
LHDDKKPVWQHKALLNEGLDDLASEIEEANHDKMTTNAQRIGLALTAFTAAWSATGFEDTPQAIIGSFIAAIAGFLKPHEAKDTE